jgi:L-ascorbate metabolism protein UlaG (beta-lactamase superfamily)
VRGCNRRSSPFAPLCVGSLQNIRAAEELKPPAAELKKKYTNGFVPRPENRIHWGKTFTKKEMDMGVEVSWLGHASFMISGDKTVYIDPWQIDGEPHDGDIVLVSHSHFDHLSPEDIRAVLKEEGVVAGPEDVIAELGRGTVLGPGQELEQGGVTIRGVAAYNKEKDFHPRERGWLGFLVEMNGKKIYYAGDTDAAEEMQALDGISLALLPVGGTYTFDAAGAAEALSLFHPQLAVPYHWGEVVGSRKDARRFAKLAETEVKILGPMESLSL